MRLKMLVVCMIVVPSFECRQAVCLLGGETPAGSCLFPTRKRTRGGGNVG
jgi:hypothetical protein